MFLKNLFFTIVTVVLFFAALEGLLAVSGVRPAVLSEDPLVSFAANVPLFEEVSADDGSTLVRTRNSQLRLFNYQEFPKQKSPGSYRIFCLGGSTTYGRPYSDRVSFCGWLRAYLEAADPSRNWEVINAGGISFASYRVARLMNDLGGYAPDLFIVYTGQNEFLEERSYGRLLDLPGWMIDLHAALTATRTYTAMGELIGAVQSGGAEGPERQQLSGEVDEILSHSVGPDSYHRDDALKRQIVSHFRLNLKRMVRIARSADAGIIFVQPAINLKDMSPFKSEHRAGLDDAARQAWQSLYQRGRALQEAGEMQEALGVYREALAIDQRYADLHYRVGQALFALGRFEAAEQAFQRAVEEDIVPLRILGEMQRSIEDVAASEGVPLIDFPAVLRQAYRARYPHAVFGEEYFRDHVHTDMEGYRLLALALLDELVSRDVVSPETAWSDARIEAVREQVIAGLDPHIEGRAMVNLGRVLDWAGKHEEAYEAFKRARELLGASPMLYDRLARSAFICGRRDESIAWLRETLELYPAMPGLHGTLAVLLAGEDRIDEAIAHCRAELEINPTDYRTHAGLAKLLETRGERDAALRHYGIALELEPDHEYALVKLAYLLIDEGRHGEALEHVQKALQVNPDQSRAHNALGLILEEQGELEQAARHFAQAVRLEPDYAAAQANLQRLNARRHGTVAPAQSSS